MEIGVDCVDIKRFDGINNDKKLLRKIFTKNEIYYCTQRNPSSQHFAARFAGKEAVMKALSPHDVQIPFNKIEIVNKRNGRPFVRLLDGENKYLQIKISLSHSKETAVAFAIVEKKAIKSNNT